MTKQKEKKTFEYRYFKYIYDGEISGRFCGTTPKSVASKIFRQLVKQKFDNKIESGKSIVFGVQECTKGQTKKNLSKLHLFNGTRDKLDIPNKVLIKRANSEEKREVNFNFTTKVKKISNR
jgi:hypothetical protein